MVSFVAITPAVSESLSEKEIKKLALEAILENPQIVMDAVNLLRERDEANKESLKKQSYLDNKELLIKLATHYIVNEKSNKGLPVNDVSRFHLGNGAIVDDVIVNANISEVGFKRSFGVMVNYLYELNSIEKNHEDFVNNKRVNISDKLKKYL